MNNPLTTPFNLTERLAKQRSENLYRQRLLLQSPQQPQVTVAGKNYLAFSSNDYLGLANHPQVVAAFKEGANLWGVGSGASHLVLGHSNPHHQLELALAELTGRERVLLMSSGYMANLAVITALVGKGDSIFHDRLNHASLLDAGLLSGARFSRYLHKDLTSLTQRLISAVGNPLIVTDGVFSMDGDLAPLTELAAVAKAHKAWLMVDDAHGIGVLGAMGGGLVEQEGLGVDDVQILVGTLGKALGTAGAFVAASEEIIETLIQFARPYIYTTSSPPAIAHATLTSLKLLQEESWRRTHLQQRIQQFVAGAQSLGLNLLPSSTPIQPLIVGTSEDALKLAKALGEQGFLVSAIRTPTVPKGTARLRITLTAAHTSEEVERLLDALAASSLATYPLEPQHD